MNLKNALPFLAGAIATAGIAVLIAAGPEHDTHGMDPVTTDEMNEMMEMSPEDMMAAMAKMGEPGEHHKELGEMVGNWHAKTSFVMDPSAPPMEGEGEMSVKWVLGGRFLQSNFKMSWVSPSRGLPSPATTTPMRSMSPPGWTP